MNDAARVKEPLFDWLTTERLIVAKKWSSAGKKKNNSTTEVTRESESESDPSSLPVLDPSPFISSMLPILKKKKKNPIHIIFYKQFNSHKAPASSPHATPQAPPPLRPLCLQAANTGLSFFLEHLEVFLTPSHVTISSAGVQDEEPQEEPEPPGCLLLSLHGSSLFLCVFVSPFVFL